MPQIDVAALTSQTAPSAPVVAAPAPMYIGDMTLKQIGASQNVSFHKLMSIQNLIAALNIILPILAIYFPEVRTLLEVLTALSAAYTLIIKTYGSLKKAYQALLKALAAAQAALTPGPGIASAAAKKSADAQKAAMKQAQDALHSVVGKLTDKVVNTPIKTYAVGLPPITLGGAPAIPSFSLPPGI